MTKSWFECDIDDALVYAARSVPTEAIEKIAPFDPKSLLDDRPEMLVGWQAELYQIALEDSAVVAHTQMRNTLCSRDRSLTWPQFHSDAKGLVDKFHILVGKGNWLPIASRKKHDFIQKSVLVKSILWSYPALVDR